MKAGAVTGRDWPCQAWHGRQGLPPAKGTTQVALSKVFLVVLLGFLECFDVCLVDVFMFFCLVLLRILYSYDVLTCFCSYNDKFVVFNRYST